MKQIFKILFLTVFTTQLFYCSEPAESRQNSLPAPDISGSIDGKSIRFKIKIPENHHAYLDKGREGRLIPISFNWETLLPGNPEVRSAPAGAFDSEVEATVLRGEGEFIFQSQESEKLSGKSVKVKSQICNDLKGICYRPTVSEVILN